MVDNKPAAFDSILFFYVFGQGVYATVICGCIIGIKYTGALLWLSVAGFLICLLMGVIHLHRTGNDK